MWGIFAYHSSWENKIGEQKILAPLIDNNLSARFLPIESLMYLRPNMASQDKEGWSGTSSVAWATICSRSSISCSGGWYFNDTSHGWATAGKYWPPSTLKKKRQPLYISKVRPAGRRNSETGFRIGLRSLQAPIKNLVPALGGGVQRWVTTLRKGCLYKGKGTSTRGGVQTPNAECEH